MPDSEGWAAELPAWVLPVTVAGDLVLVREGGVLVSVGAVCASPAGFEFYLTFAWDSAQAAQWRAHAPAQRVLGFHARTPGERASVARIGVGFAEGHRAGLGDLHEHAREAGHARTEVRWRGFGDHLRRADAASGEQVVGVTAAAARPGGVQRVLERCGRADRYRQHGRGRDPRRCWPGTGSVARGSGAMVSGQDGAAGPPPGAVPVVMPTDVILARAAVLVVWAGAVTVYPEGFAFTLRVLSDTRTGPPPAPWALEAAERDRMTWLKIRYADGRARAADLNSNTPPRQLRGPHLRLLYASDSDGCADSRWWVTPLPPPGPVELTIHLNGQKAPAGVGRLDGAALLGAAARAETVWPAPPAAPGLA